MRPLPSKMPPAPIGREQSRCRNHNTVDLWGRLSNPRHILETLAEQGSQTPRRPLKPVDDQRNRASTGSSGEVRHQEGRLSNPVQRRLTEHDVDELVSAYIDGSSIDALAARNGINRTTIISHLDRRGIERRKVVRKMTDRSVLDAANRYESGDSLTVVAAAFGVDARTLAREFERAGIRTRPRRGWPPQS